MGGILWRITLHYGLKSLFAAALAEPSTNAYVHGHVNCIGGEIDDIVSGADIALLLSTTEDFSLWPPADIFEMYEKWKESGLMSGRPGSKNTFRESNLVTRVFS